MIKTLVIAAVMLLSGCVPVQRGGTTHYLVIGFGIVSVPTVNTPDAQVIKSQAVGISLSDQPGIKVGIGYSSSRLVQVKTNQSLLIEVSDAPGKPLIVKTQ